MKCQDYIDYRFCFKFKEDLDISQDERPESEYWFGQTNVAQKPLNDNLSLQKRRVSSHPVSYLTQEDATQNCEFYCTEKLEGMLTFEEPIGVSATDPDLKSL